jgi:hypothetical protein
VRVTFSYLLALLWMASAVHAQDSAPGTPEFFKAAPIEGLTFAFELTSASENPLDAGSGTDPALNVGFVCPSSLSFSVQLLARRAGPHTDPRLTQFDSLFVRAP